MSTILRQLPRVARTLPKSHRQFSILTSARSTIQSARAQIFEANTLTPHQPADWGRVIKHARGPAMFYLPLMGMLLGWPLLVEYGFDASRGIRTTFSDYVHY